jgi:Fe-S cluster biosynthesis and repair protein YggX
MDDDQFARLDAEAQTAHVKVMVNEVSKTLTTIERRLNIMGAEARAMDVKEAREYLWGSIEED